MTEQKGDIFYKIEWFFGSELDETCSPEDREPASFELERYKVRSVRKQDKRLPRRTVTAYQMIELLTVDRKGEFLKQPYALCKVQWSEGRRPDQYRPTKKGAYAAAMADIRKHPDFDAKKHAALLARIKGQLTRARKESA